MPLEYLLGFMGRRTLLHLLPIVGLVARTAGEGSEGDALRYLHSCLGRRLAELEAERQRAAA